MAPHDPGRSRGGSKLKRIVSAQSAICAQLRKWTILDHSRKPDYSSPMTVRISDAGSSQLRLVVRAVARTRPFGVRQPSAHAGTVPQYDDSEPLGFSIFRTLLDDALGLSDLTLPRTFFGRSQIDRVSFRNSDLHESNLRWNDFNGTDFSGADLGSSDMRASLFHNVLLLPPISMAQICDNRLSLCSFEEATMKHAILTRQQGAAMRLSETQRQHIDWRDEDGPEPGGG
jgi:BTB/POZ domain-containing protein KCTD9